MYCVKALFFIITNVANIYFRSQVSSYLTVQYMYTHTGNKGII